MPFGRPCVATIATAILRGRSLPIWSVAIRAAYPPWSVSLSWRERGGSSVSSQQESSDRVLYIVTCATPAARDIGKLVTLAQDAGWRPFVIAIPSALRFIDQPALEAQTGAAVRSEYKEPGTPDVLPPADAIVVGDASFNTINKWCGRDL